MNTHCPFATAFALTLVISTALVEPAQAAGIPVNDAANFTQNKVTAMESAAMAAKQIEEFKNQLEQFENMLQNTAAIKSFTWDKAQMIIGKLIEQQDMLNYYSEQAGSLQGYLDQYQDLAQYRDSPCFNGGECGAAELAAQQANRILASGSQRMANEAMLKGLAEQQANLQFDAGQLETLQLAAQDPKGQVEAIQYASQLASQQNNQLLQMRGLMIAEQNAMAARNQAIVDREALETAASEHLRGGTLTASPVRSW